MFFKVNMSGSEQVTHAVSFHTLNTLAYLVQQGGKSSNVVG
jgi:hypothetical protein